MLAFPLIFIYRNSDIASPSDTSARHPDKVCSSLHLTSDAL